MKKTYSIEVFCGVVYTVIARMCILCNSWAMGPTGQTLRLCLSSLAITYSITILIQKENRVRSSFSSSSYPSRFPLHLSRLGGDRRRPRVMTARSALTRGMQRPYNWLCESVFEIGRSVQNGFPSLCRHMSKISAFPHNQVARREACT
jgi:hypothetical protein